MAVTRGINALSVECVCHSVAKPKKKQKTNPVVKFEMYWEGGLIFKVHVPDERTVNSFRIRLSKKIKATSIRVAVNSALFLCVTKCHFTKFTFCSCT